MQTLPRVIKNSNEHLIVKRTVSLMTPLGLVEGEILRHLENRAFTAIQDLIHDLEWPAHMILMATGSLIRQGHIRGTQHEAAVVIEPVANIERRAPA